MIVNARSGGLDLFSPETFDAPISAFRFPTAWSFRVQNPPTKGIGRSYLKTCLLISTLSEYLSFINAKNQYVPNVHFHSFIIKNYSPIVDFGLYHSEEAPPNTGNRGISVNILQPGVRKDLSFFYTQALLTGLSILSQNFDFVLHRTSIRMMIRQSILYIPSRYLSIPTRMTRCLGKFKSTSVSPTATQSVSGQNVSGPAANFSIAIILGQNVESRGR